MKLLTFLPMEQINDYAKLEGQQLNTAKEVLAYELTNLVHGEEEAKKAQEAARAIFSGGVNSANMPTTQVEADSLTDDSIGLMDLMVLGGMVKSKGEARRLITQGGVSLNDEKWVMCMPPSARRI